MDEMFPRTRGLKAKLDLEMELHDSLDNAIRKAGEMRAEIERLRGWLEYIAGRFAPADECADRALRGEPAPGGFPSANSA